MTKILIFITGRKMMKCLPNAVGIFFKAPKASYCLFVFFFFLRIYPQFQVRVQVQQYSELMTFFLKQHTLYIQCYCFDEWMPTNAVSIVSRFLEQLYSLYSQPSPVCPRLLNFQSFANSKVKCRGISATFFSSRTRNAGSSQMFSHRSLQCKNTLWEEFPP